MPVLHRVVCFAALCLCLIAPAHAQTDLAATHENVLKTLPGDQSAGSVLGLFESLTRNHPEGLEGGPRMVIIVEPSEEGTAMKVTVERTGLLNDSVSADRHVGFATQRAGKWVLTGLWRQQLCARGVQRGKWTKTPCA